MTLSDLLNELEDAGMIDINNDAEIEGRYTDIDTWLYERGIDSETPIPMWNEDAQAWEV